MLHDRIMSAYQPITLADSKNSRNIVAFFLIILVEIAICQKEVSTMFKELKTILRKAKYQRLNHLTGQTIQIDSFELMVENVREYLRQNIGIKLPYVGRWNATSEGGLKDSHYVFNVIGLCDMKFQWNAEPEGDFETGKALLKSMYVDDLFYDEQISQIAKEVTENQFYLMLLMGVDHTHPKFLNFRTKIRTRDPQMIQLGRNGIPSEYFPVNCEIIEAAITNAPHLWQFRYTSLWMYTYVY